MKIISINEAHAELKKAVEQAGGYTKFLRKHRLDACHRSGLKKCVDGKIKPFPLFMKQIGIVKTFVKL